MLLEVGRVCIKKYGRDAGSRAVITAVQPDGFVKIMTADRQKERKCNPAHLEFLNEVVDTKNRELVFKTLGVQEKTAKPQQEKKATAAPKKAKA